jgi:hypothetical protein
MYMYTCTYIYIYLILHSKDRQKNEINSELGEARDQDEWIVYYLDGRDKGVHGAVKNFRTVKTIGNSPISSASLLS